MVGDLKINIKIYLKIYNFYNYMHLNLYFQKILLKIDIINKNF